MSRFAGPRGGGAHCSIIVPDRPAGILPEGAHPPAVRALVYVRSLYAGVEEARVGGARLLPIAKVLRLR